MGAAVACAVVAQAVAAAGYTPIVVARNQGVGEPRVFVDATSRGPRFFYLGPGTDNKGNLNTLFWWSNDGSHWSGPATTNQANGGNDSDVAVDSNHTIYVADLSDPGGNSSIPISIFNPSTHRFSHAGTVAPGVSGLDREWIASPSRSAIVAIALDDGGNERLWISGDAARHFRRVGNVDTGVGVAGPLVTGKASPGHPAPLYFTYLKGSQLRLAKSTDGGNHWARYLIANNQSVGLFPVVASDSTANLYATWSGTDPASNTLNVIMVAASHNGGKTWGSMRAVSSTKKDAFGDPPAAIFPWVVAGNTGRVDVTFAVEHPVITNSFEGSDITYPGTTWDLRLAQTTNGTSARPTWTGSVLKANFHRGSICTFGTGCVGPQQFGLVNVATPFDRRDLDFFGAALDGKGNLFAPYMQDRPIVATDPTSALFSTTDLDLIRQLGGTNLGSTGH